MINEVPKLRCSRGPRYPRAVIGAVLMSGVGCRFPYPADVPDDDDAATVHADASADAARDGAPPPTRWTLIAAHAARGAPATAPVRWYQPDANGRLVSAWTSNELDNATSAAVTDFDGDGDLDLAVGNFSLNSTSRNRVYRNDGGTFTTTWEAGETTPTFAVRWGDLDGDQRPDLVTATTDGVFMYRNTGGRLGAASSLITDGAYDAVLGDVDADGDLDIAVALPGAPASIYTNDGQARFQRLAWNGPSDAVSLKFGDYDDDGDLDVAVGRAQGFTVYRAEGTTLVAAFYGTDLSPRFVSRTNVDWVDDDGDGDLDLLVGHCTTSLGSTCPGGPVQIYRNLGGGFAAGPTVTAAGLAWTAVENENTSAVTWLPVVP